MAEKQEKEENNNEDLAPAADMADDLTPEKINDFSLFAMVSFLEFWKELNEVCFHLKKILYFIYPCIDNLFTFQKVFS